MATPSNPEFHVVYVVTTKVIRKPVKQPSEQTESFTIQFTRGSEKFGGPLTGSAEEIALSLRDLKDACDEASGLLPK